MGRRQRLVVSAACALVAVLVCALYTGHVRTEAARARTEALERYGGEVVALAVATRTLEAGEVVSLADVDLRDWLSSLAPKDAQLSLDEVIGREVTVPAAEGAPLTALNFRDVSELAEIPSGHVAVSVPITEKLGVSGTIAVGAHVVAYRATEGAAELIGGNATVLAVPGSAGSLAGRGTLTIAVDARDVPAVLAASTAGDLRLVVPADDVREFAGARAQPVEVLPVSAGEDAATDKGKAEGANDDTAAQPGAAAETDGEGHADGEQSDGDGSPKEAGE